ncbi:hypothetical protein GCM10011387_00350 [Pedobacter quisquiliarum]|uniref:SdiA-regulated n=1 Tax=Pedobacter quisquiliarum TaxID=1834438 RepID=A0A916TXR8_9SPHI|nr:SdiA-regulated domain-containing protein [Pedobacter quisquiliarum]GGC50894.1 hypothetical protein GCM10011387_00350 [Pedobacter quisquiliarum]
MKQRLKIITVLVFAGITILFGCKPAIKSANAQPADYDFTKAEKFNMPESLLEISGIAFNAYDPETIYAIQDEEGRLFSLKWGIKKATSIKFGPRGDYEDLAILNNQVYVLKSSGDIYSFPLDMELGDVSDSTAQWDDFLPKAEYESLYADEAAHVLYVLTKSGGKKKKNTLGYKINVDKTTKQLGTITEFSLDQDAIEAMGYKLKSGLKVSALSQHPKTKEWYILSSAEKLLVVAKQDWQIEMVYDLDASTFNQPEGIAFDKDLNLYISSEGDEITNGNIQKFTPATNTTTNP